MDFNSFINFMYFVFKTFNIQIHIMNFFFYFRLTVFYKLNIFIMFYKMITMFEYNRAYECCNHKNNDSNDYF